MSNAQFNPEEKTFDIRDEYQRRPVAEKIIQLLASGAKVSPMIIDGGWGTGKTEFCHKLINLFSVQASVCKVIYVDAFKADHAAEPLLTLLSAVLNKLPEDQRPALRNKALPILRFALKTGLKAGVSWVLKQDATQLADDFDADIKSATDEAINASVTALLADHEKAHEGLVVLKEALRVVAQKTPIVIFVDELDRCRPDFAVHMLECIKHVFDIEGVKFVLVTNTTQLRASINHCYGITVDSQRYLDKFIGFSFVLPNSFTPSGRDSVLAAERHLFDAITQSKLLEVSVFIECECIEFIKLLVKENQITLRQAETFVRHLEIYQILTKGSGFKKGTKYVLILFRIFSIFIFCFFPEITESIVRKIFIPESIAPLLGKKEVKPLDGNGDFDDADVIFAFFVLASGVKPAQHIPQDEKIKQIWAVKIDQLFGVGSSMHSCSLGQKINAFSEPISILRLGQ